MVIFWFWHSNQAIPSIPIQQFLFTRANNFIHSNGEHSHQNIYYQSYWHTQFEILLFRSWDAIRVYFIFFIENMKKKKMQINQGRLNWYHSKSACRTSCMRWMRLRYGLTYTQTCTKNEMLKWFFFFVVLSILRHLTDNKRMREELKCLMTNTLGIGW